MASPDINEPVFYDPAGRRGRRVGRASTILAVLVTSFVLVLIGSILLNPVLPRLNIRPSMALPQAQDIKPVAPPVVKTRQQREAAKAQIELRNALAKKPAPPARRPSQVKVAPPPAKPPVASAPETKPPAAPPLAIGFYVNWDDSSYESLKRNIAELDWVVPQWLQLQDGSDPLIRDIHLPALDLMRRQRPQMPIIPMIQNANEGVFNGQLLAKWVANEASRQQLINAITQFVTQNSFGGICLDFEEVPTTAQSSLLTFVQELRGVFKPKSLIVTMAAPFDDSDWDYRAYAATLDYVMLMAYDEHWSTGAAGPIAGQDWYLPILKTRLDEIPANKTLICFGGYGYDWAPGQEAQDLTFQEAVLSARDSEAQIQFDSASLNPYFTYDDEDETKHAVWLLDGVTAYNQIRSAAGYNPAGFALWRMGSEDPSVWSIFGTGKMTASPDGLSSIKYGYDIDFEGTGEILQVKAKPQDGVRAITIDPAKGSIISESLVTIPSSYVIQRTNSKPGVVALTFDDGPDPVWTPRILDILKQENVKATFFIIGTNGQAHPNLVRRVVAEGHDLGNHTFTHPNLAEVPMTIVSLELNANQRLIESLTGRQTHLFRPPYFGDAEPTTPDEVNPLVEADRLGYLTVGLRVDPNDWALPGVDAIVKAAIDGVTNPDLEERGQVILLHDGGGDREQTIEALPQIIQALRARGYQFQTISELINLPRDQVMPPLPPDSGRLARANEFVFYAFSAGGWILHWIFLIGIALGLGRMLFIGSLAFAQWVRSRKREAMARKGVVSEEALVTILVPAYNEEKVINQTIVSLLAADYSKLEIIVIDDGSPDRTSEVVRERFGNEPRVTLYRKQNGGKAEALNFGLRHASGEIVVALDADTIFAPQTIGAMARRFTDPRVGAIAGNAKVGNRINLVTRWQALEYITSQNLDRRAFASLNCITVVPGAVGAWRKELVEEAGGFTSDTLAEDQDLTMRIRRLGRKIGYEESAIAWTEAPDTIRTLAKQRFRWSFGTLQCVWKHRDALLRPRYGTLGFIALPNVWLFQIIFPLLSPLMDLLLIWTLISAGIDRYEHQQQSSFTNLKQVLFYYALFLAVDWLAAAFAFMLERTERWSLLFWLFLQRFCYRQVMYYVMVKSVASALRGGIVGWGKLERKATVEAQP